MKVEVQISQRVTFSKEIEMSESDYAIWNAKLDQKPRSAAEEVFELCVFHPADAEWDGDMEVETFQKVEE